MSTLSLELPARRTAWLVDETYQVRLLEQARSLAASDAHVRPTRLRLAEASVPETRENAELAERDEVRVRFTFRVTEVSAEQASQRRGPRRAA